MSEAVDEYRALRARIDAAAGGLAEIHCKHITCHAGCAECCTDLSVSAVEYTGILADLRAAGVRDLPFDPDAPCAFLKDSLCMLYRVRPMICRTHGLPVAFVDDEAEEPGGVNVSFCPKNFTAADPEDLDFGPENTLDLDGLNVTLAQINERFIRESAARGEATPPRRVPLRQLRADMVG